MIEPISLTDIQSNKLISKEIIMTTIQNIENELFTLSQVDSKDDIEYRLGRIERILILHFYSTTSMKGNSSEDRFKKDKSEACMLKTGDKVCIVQNSAFAKRWAEEDVIQLDKDYTVRARRKELEKQLEEAKEVERLAEYQRHLIREQLKAEVRKEMMEVWSSDDKDKILNAATKTARQEIDDEVAHEIKQDRVARAMAAEERIKNSNTRGRQKAHSLFANAGGAPLSNGLNDFRSWD